MVRKTRFKEKQINFEPNEMLKLSRKTGNTCVYKNTLHKVSFIYMLYVRNLCFSIDHPCLSRQNCP